MLLEALEMIIVVVEFIHIISTIPDQICSFTA